MDSRLHDAVVELLEQSKLPDAEAARRVALAVDGDYWRRLAPGLTIGESADALPVAPGVSTVDQAVAHFADEGYFQLPPVVSAETITLLNQAIDAVKAGGWPAVFAWVYDQFWACARVPAIVRLVASRLGAGCAQIPHVFVHIVPSTSGAVGWTPHFDGRAQGRVSVWLALTDATLDNGCMHLVPSRSLPDAFRIPTLTGGMVLAADAFRALQASRALPVAQGSALGWEFNVLHWGGPCVTPGVARRSISMEFLAAGESPDADEQPLVALDGPLPSLAVRLRTIAAAIHTYERFEPGLVRYRGVADGLATSSLMRRTT
jgi:ectoine hydroxylase-related dioxygenase (phytanoyl-CoA dioxygenase family)